MQYLNHECPRGGLLVVDEKQPVIFRQRVGLAEPLIPLSKCIGDPDVVGPDGVPPLILEENAMRGLLLDDDRFCSRRNRSGNASGQDEESCDDKRDHADDGQCRYGRPPESRLYGRFGPSRGFGRSTSNGESMPEATRLLTTRRWRPRGHQSSVSVWPRTFSLPVPVLP